jgi:hypothetical protein
MMYSVEKASRSTFLGEVQSAKRIADIQQAASDAEASGEQLLLWLAIDRVVPSSLPSYQSLC